MLEPPGGQLLREFGVQSELKQQIFRRFLDCKPWGLLIVSGGSNIDFLSSFWTANLRDGLSFHELKNWIFELMK